MPNHCSNDLYISGPVAEVERFMEKAVTLKGEGATLNEDFIMPYPKSFDQLDEIAKNWQSKCDEEWKIVKEKAPDANWSTFYTIFTSKNGERPRDGYNMGGYEWCNSNWGTKWGSYNGSEAKLTKTGKTAKLKLTFDTAWCTYNETFMTTLSNLFPELEIKNRWFERGMAVQGVNIFKGGVLLESKSKRYTGERGG
jgi:hypothetical protein